MAHIRQILANLSISAAEFKKNPKSVIKAVKSEPIAVIINDKPAFYCVPADILESLYSKFYEMNEIQNIQDLDQADSVGTGSDDDGSFGVRDIFQTVEDEQTSKLLQPSEDFIDPLSNHVADPLDEEVANQLNYNLQQSTKSSSSKGRSKGTGDNLGYDQNSELNTLDNDLSHPELAPDPVAFDSDFADLGLLSTPGIDGTNAIGTQDLMGPVDPISGTDLPGITTKSGFNLPTKAESGAKTEAAPPAPEAGLAPTKLDQAKLDQAKLAQAEARDVTEPPKSSQNAIPDSAEAKAKRKKSGAKAKGKSSATKAPRAPERKVMADAAQRKVGADAVELDPMAQATPQERELEESATMSEVAQDVSQQIADSNKGMRRLVSGPHSFTLEHVAKTYSPYAQKKIQAKLKKSKTKKSGK